MEDSSKISNFKALSKTLKISKLTPLILMLTIVGCFNGSDSSSEATDASSSPVVTITAGENPEEIINFSNRVTSVPWVDDYIESKKPAVVRPDYTTLMHKALLGPLANATVTISPINMPDTILASTITAEDGTFIVDADISFGDRLLLVKVTGGTDLDADDDGVLDALPTPNNGTLMMLVDGDTLGTKEVNVNILTDVIARKVLNYAAYMPDNYAQQALNDFTSQLVKTDINFDGIIDYVDILSFDPRLLEHRQSLTFSYSDAALNAQVVDGTSLVSKYHNNSSLITTALNESFGDLLEVNLPTSQELERINITVTANIGGTVSSDDNPEIVAFANGADTYKFSMSKKDQPIVLKATADSGFVFSSWKGCPEVQSDNTCLVLPSEDHLVSASFMLPESILAADVPALMNLDSTDDTGSVGVVFENNVMIVTTEANSTLVAELYNLKANSVFHTSIVKRPQVRVIEILSSDMIFDGAYFQAKYVVEDVDFFDIYQQASFDIPTTKLLLDDLTSIETIDIDGETTKVFLDNRANREFAPGPSAAAVSNEQQLCEPTEQALFARDSGNGRAVVCVPQKAKPVKSGDTCDANSVATTVLDGRVYCTDPIIDACSPNNTSVQNFSQGAFQASSNQSKVDNTSACYNGFISVDTTTKINNQLSPVVQNFSNSLSKHTPTLGFPEASTASANEPKELAKQVWIKGYGQAFNLEGNVYITENPNKPGMVLVELDDQLMPLSSAESMQAQKEYCNNSNTSSYGCVITQNYASSVGDIGTKKALSTLDRIGWTKATVKIDFEIEANIDGSFKFIAPARVEIVTGGSALVKPIIDLTIEGARQKKALAPIVLPYVSDKPLFEKIFKFDFAKQSPVGPVLAAGVSLTLGVEFGAEGEFKLHTELPVVVQWNAMAGAGWGCYGIKWKRLAKSGFLSSVLGWVKVPVRECKIDSYMSQNSTINAYVDTEINLKFKGLIQPFVKATIFTGLRRIAENLVTLNVRGYVQGTLDAEINQLRISTVPADLQERNNQKLCYEGGWKAKGRLDTGVKAYILFTSNGQPLGKIFSFREEIELYNTSMKLAEFEDGRKPNAKCTNKGLSNTLDFKNSNKPILHGGQQIATKNHILHLTKLGELIVYENLYQLGQKGRVIWSSGSKYTGRGRSTFKLYFIRGHILIDKNNYQFWRSKPNSGDELRLESSGLLNIVDSKSKSIWSSGKIPPPPSISFNPGGFELKSGDSIDTMYHRMKLESNGNLAVYVINQENNEDGTMVWNTNTPFSNATKVQFNKDGRLVVLGYRNKQIWSSANRKKGSKLILKPDGELSIYNDDREELWHTATTQDLMFGHYELRLLPNQSIKTSNRIFKLYRNRIVLYENFYGKEGQRLWWQWFDNETKEVIYRDGRLRVYDKNNNVMWNSSGYKYKTVRGPLKISSLGNLATYDFKYQETWKPLQKIYNRDIYVKDLKEGILLLPGQKIQNQDYVLYLKQDGNLIVYKVKYKTTTDPTTGRQGEFRYVDCELFHSNTANKGVQALKLKEDGALFLIGGNKGDKIIWSAYRQRRYENYDKYSSHYLKFASWGSIEVMDKKNGKVVWASKRGKKKRKNQCW